MNRSLSHAQTHWSPLYFLIPLGLGGLGVSFFMYPFFWLAHPGAPVPVFEDFLAGFSDGGFATRAMIVASVAAIALFVTLHVASMVWNIRKYREYVRTPAYAALRSGNGETQLSVVPLALAMSINVGFVAGLVFVPGLWSIVEYLFPLALLAFLAVGWYALAILGDFYGRVLVRGGFDCSRNNSFAQLLPAFALGMVGVGLAAPAAMSANATVIAVSYVASTFFVVAAFILLIANAILGMRAMLENGASDEGAPTLWIVIPILTVLGIALVRQGDGMRAGFGVDGGATGNFTMLTGFVAVQFLAGLLGWRVLRGKRYFARYVFGRERSPASYALVCPPVAIAVLGHFYINAGLVGAGVLDRFSLAFWLLSAIAVLAQAAAIYVLVTLNAGHFSAAGALAGPAPAR